MLLLIISALKIASICNKILPPCLFAIPLHFIPFYFPYRYFISYNLQVIILGLYLNTVTASAPTAVTGIQLRRQYYSSVSSAFLFQFFIHLLM